jgi:hypothetical protein
MGRGHERRHFLVSHLDELDPLARFIRALQGAETPLIPSPEYP